MQLDLLRKSAGAIGARTSNEKVLYDCIIEQDKVIAELRDQLAAAEKQLDSKQTALSILQKARKVQEENLSRQVGIIEALESQISRMCPSPSATKQPDAPLVQKARRRKTTGDVYRDSSSRSARLAVFDYRLTHAQVRNQTRVA